MTDVTEDLKRLSASRKAHTGIVTRKSNDFDSIINKSPEEVTADDKTLAETILDTITDKVANFGEFNLKLVDAIENTDGALEAELLKQDEIEIQVKSHMKSIHKWRRNQNSDVGETSSIDSNHRDNNVKLPLKHLPTFDEQN